MQQHIKKIFLVEIVISCLTCFQRADYNLPLFTFAYFLWDYKTINSQKLRLYYLFISTWVVDFIWLIYWGVTWGSVEYKLYGPSGPASFVLVLSIISFIIKLVIVVISYLYDPEVKPAVTNFVSNLKSVFSYTPERSYD